MYSLGRRRGGQTDRQTELRLLRLKQIVLRHILASWQPLSCGSIRRVFNSGRLGVNTPKKFQSLRLNFKRWTSRRPNQSAFYYVYLFIINLELTSGSVSKCFARSKNFCWLSCFWVLHFMKTWHGNHILGVYCPPINLQSLRPRATPPLSTMHSVLLDIKGTMHSVHQGRRL